MILLLAGSCEKPISPFTEAPGPDFHALFNGRDFTGWNIGNVKPDENAWSVEDGVIHCKGEPRIPYLILTEKDYENFEFYGEFKVSKDCNSGIFFHVPLAGRESRLGFETQILDDSGKKPDKNSTGSIYDVVPPLMNAMKRAGSWNRYHVLFDWPNCKIWLNDVLVQDTDFSANPMLKYRMRRGPVGLSNHGYAVDYRNLWIKELPDKDTGLSVFNGIDLTGWSSIGDADWHVENGMIVATKGQGYLISNSEYDNVYFHAYVECDTLMTYDSRFYYRWKSPSDPGYPVDFYNFKDAVRYTAPYGDKIPGTVIPPMRSALFLYRIISADRESQIYLNEFIVSDNKLLGRSPHGRIALYRSPEDGVIRLKGLCLRPIEGPGL
ncbi:DUF1080 domain-containing protein [bacterium]|nr:DUF1080 domain-containing protein [bacterium]